MRGRAFLVCSSVFMLGTFFRRLASLRSMSIELKFSVANLGVACRFFRTFDQATAPVCGTCG